MVDVVGLVLGVRVLGQPDLQVRQQHRARAVKQHPVALARSWVPAIKHPVSRNLSREMSYSA